MGGHMLRRRQFLELAAGGVATGALLSAACQPSAPVAPTRAPSPPGRVGGPLPTYVQSQGGPKPEFASNGPLYEEGFTDYPASRFKAWNKPTPGAGGDVLALVVVTRPAVPNALERNPAWQQINKQLNVN